MASVGGAIATALADAGHLVVGYGRRANGWQHGNGGYHQWDLHEDAAPLDSSVSVVVHCAGVADDWAPFDEQLRTHRDGTRAVRAAFPRARFIHISTSSVSGLRKPSIMATETEPLPTQPINAYSATKALAERELAGTNAVILRPHGIYGPGDTTLLPRVSAGVRRGTLRLPNGGKTLHSLTHIDNLVGAVAAVIATPTASGVFNISDAEPVVLADALLALFAERGEHPRSLLCHCR